MMHNLTISLRDRLTEFLKARTVTTEVLPANTDPATVQVEEARYFNLIPVMRNFPQALIFLPSDPETPAARVKISWADEDASTITFSEPLDIELPVGTIIKRAPNWTEVKQIRLGDPTTLSYYPTVCIEPATKSPKWATLTGTDEHGIFNIITHVLEDNTENCVLSLARITEDIEDLLMADLHIFIKNMDKGEYNRVYNSFVQDVNYTKSNKGAFVRTSNITWFGDTFWCRFIAAQAPGNAPFT